MSSTEDKSLLAAAAPPPRRLKSIAAAAALLGLSFGLGAVVASSVKGNTRAAPPARRRCVRPRNPRSQQPTTTLHQQIMATYNTVPLKETAADDKPLLERNVNVSVKKILGAAVLVSFVIGSLAAVAVEPQSVSLTPMAFSEKRHYYKCGDSCTHDNDCGSCGNDCVATRAEINRSSLRSSR